MQADWINNSKEWNENIPSPLSPSDAAAFQAQLNQICGTEPDGTPHLRLAWGMDLDSNSPLCDALWDREGYWIPRHHWTTKHQPKANPQTGLIGLEPIYIGVPRFFVLAYLPPAHIPDEERAAAWQDGEHFTEEMNRNQWIDSLEIWKHINRNAEGDFGCCLEAGRDSLNCYGMYRPPDAEDLRYLCACYQQWQRLERAIDPSKRFNPADHAARWRQQISNKKRVEAAQAREHAEDFVDFFKTGLRPSIVVPNQF